MRLSAKALLVSTLALVAGGALAAVNAPAADEPIGFNDQLSDQELAMSLAACETFGDATSDVSWCVEAAAAAASDEDIEDLAGDVAIDVDGSDVTATLPGENTVLVTSVPGEA